MNAFCEDEILKAQPSGFFRLISGHPIGFLLTHEPPGHEFYASNRIVTIGKLAVPDRYRDFSLISLASLKIMR